MSVVAPVLDEAANLAPLVETVRAALEGRFDWELVLVDDGSRDGSPEVIRDLAARDSRVVGVLQPGHRGQTTAVGVGVAHARGELVATIDADLQNDPRDLWALWQALGDHDAAVGYRVKRRDTLVRRLSSRIANAVRNRLTGDQVRDTGCSLKLFRREAIGAIPLFEGMHRFLPTLLRMHGFSVVEHPVSHHPRQRGRSKYGIRNRLLRSLVDLFAVRWMRSRALPRRESPTVVGGRGPR
ncbi:MAG: glycosyltransferase family 2 protein [Planctomycetota bacterium]